MNSFRGSKLSLFLMELIIAILFFSVSAAVCVRLFASAHIMAEETEALSNATKWSQSISEAFWGQEGDLIDISKCFPDSYITTSDEDSSESPETLIIVFDENWEIIDHSLSNASYEAILHVSQKDASEVYADVTDYQVSYEGQAIVGEIAIIDIRKDSEILSEIPKDPATVIFSHSVDYYLGKEAG